MELADKIRAESISEMNHAELFIERILHLAGIPNLTRLEKIRVGDRVADQLQFDLDEHWLESQLELIRQVGEANYLTQQIHTANSKKK